MSCARPPILCPCSGDSWVTAILWAHGIAPTDPRVFVEQHNAIRRLQHLGMRSWVRPLTPTSFGGMHIGITSYKAGHVTSPSACRGMCIEMLRTAVMSRHLKVWRWVCHQQQHVPCLCAAALALTCMLMCFGSVVCTWCLQMVLPIPFAQAACCLCWLLLRGCLRLACCGCPSPWRSTCCPARLQAGQLPLQQVIKQANKWIKAWDKAWAKALNPPRLKVSA